MATISATIKIMDGFSAPLDKLSNGLKSSQSAMSNLKSAISSANPFSSLNKDAGQTGGIFKSVLGGNIIGSGITKGISTVTSGLGGMVGDLNEASATWQTFNGNMAMLGKGPKEIAATRDDLTKFAQQTIYSASDMASTYSQLAAVGIKGTDKLVKGFGGLASAAKDPQQAMKTLSQQATQAAAKPQIQWQDFKLMLEQTPAGMAAVAKTMGMSTSDLVKSVQDGKIATQDFFDAIAKTGTNADFTKMATQYKTMGQAMAGFRETLTTSLQPAWDKLSQVGIKAISGITDKIGEVDFSALGDKLVSALDTAKKGLTAFWDSFKDTGALTFLETAFKSIGTAAQSVFENLSKGSKDKDPFSFLKGLGTGIGNTLKGLARGISAVSTAIGEMDPDDLKLLGTALLVLKGGMKGIVFTAVVAGLKALGKLDVDQLNGLAKAVTSLAAAFAVIKAGMKIGKGVSKVSDIFGSLGKGGKTPELPIPDSGKSGKSAGNLIKMGGALLMIGGAVLLAGAGFALLASGIAKIAKTGSTGIGILIGLGVALLVLLVAVRLLGPGLIAGAVGFLIFGAALLLIGVAVFLASAGIALLAEQLPMLSKYGAGAAQGLSLLALAVGLFGLMSIIAAVGLVLLAVALIALGVGFIVAAVGALLFGVALVLVAVFGILAAVGLILLGVALLLVTVFSLTAAIGMLLLGVAVLLVAVFGIIAAVGMLLLGVALALVMVFAIIAAVGMILLGVSLILVMAFAIVAAVGLILLGVALMLVMVFGIVAAVGLLLLGVAWY
ncbi:phage tail fibers [Agrilactobacillus composti DSM 18527 = JCM 14202]|uniref:tape measure protein n=1 Tax=Agrilactobacillus composti TaxID=398555 RepID=UPI00042DEB7F|nr:tape measure protein [Agrilactobacillus composti]GAF41122.1 phage tail fibers [Agrilactobacillus composti DSM 18527 = JCM 14202]